MENKEKNKALDKPLDKPADKPLDTHLTDDDLTPVAGGIEGLPDDPDGYIAHPRYQPQ